MALYEIMYHRPGLGGPWIPTKEERTFEADEHEVIDGALYLRNRVSGAIETTYIFAAGAWFMVEIEGGS